MSTAQQADGIALQKEYQLHIHKTNLPVKIDGELNDAAWRFAEVTTAFWKKFPTDEGRPRRKTEVRILYDDKFLYFGIVAYDSGKAFVQSLKRDIGHDNNDGVGIILDPTNQRTNGFVFVVNAFNAQSDDQLPFSNDGPSWSWDTKWFSQTKREKDQWTAEIAIPFKSLRYTVDKLLWGLNFVRIDTKTNEYSTWTHMPMNFRSMDLGYTGALVWKDPPPQPGSNMVFVPYINSTLSSDQENAVNTNLTANAGFDGKVALSSALNLDLTVNPDFSQVEVDQQITNLSRFSIFYPEKRTFFLENSDLFAQIGIPSIRPFYSRTIGLDKNANPIPIIFGARLSGNLTKSTRIGFMNVQTASKGDYSPENYTAASISQKVLKRSTIKAYFLNRENFIPDSAKKANPLDVYGRNTGLEFNFTNLKGTWSSWLGLHHSFKPTISADNNYIDAGFNYNGRHVSTVLDVGNIGTNFYTDMGYVERINNYDAVRDTTIRVGFKQIYQNIDYKIFPKARSVNAHDLRLNNFFVFNPDNTLNERSNELQYSLSFKNTSFCFVFANNNEVNLLFPTSFTDTTPLPAGHYQFNQMGIGYQSDFRKKFSFFARYSGGEFYNGSFNSIRTVIGIRKIPHLNFSLQMEYTKLSFPDPYGNNELVLIAPKLEINFATNLFWTTFVQYNTQSNNFNINSRFQYRFKPMSDIFIVYTDNYFVTPEFTNRNRALVFKMNYWLNL